MTEWHRLFGLALSDLFANSPWTVELEKDLSFKRQLLDVIIVRRGRGTFTGKLPDGLDQMADHNLLTYKSLHGVLDDWSLKELTGHYVNYRKQIGASILLPEDAFRLYGISTRFPDKLAGRVSLQQTAEGVYETWRGTDRFVIVVLSQISHAEHNSLWHLFSARRELVEYGAAHYHARTSDASTILDQLFHRYQLEGLSMPYTIEDFRRDVRRDILEEATAEERLKGLSAEELLKYMPAEEVLKQLPLDVIEKYLARAKEATPTKPRSAKRKTKKR